MTTNTATLKMLWEAASADSVVDSQRWILTTMQSHGEKIITMLWRILGNEQDVCDTYQQTFLQLAHYKGGVKPKNVKAFVFRTASNIAISIVRRRKVHAQACQAIAEHSPQHHTPDPAGDLDAQHLRATLRNHITKLPEQLRQVIMMKDLADMPYTQVANILGISVQAARVYRCRAVKLLSHWIARKEAGQ